MCSWFGRHGVWEVQECSQVAHQSFLRALQMFRCKHSYVHVGAVWYTVQKHLNSWKAPPPHISFQGVNVVFLNAITSSLPCIIVETKLPLLHLYSSLQLLSPYAVAVYGSLCALASYDRQDLYNNVIASR